MEALPCLPTLLTLVATPPAGEECLRLLAQDIAQGVTADSNKSGVNSRHHHQISSQEVLDGSSARAAEEASS